MIYAVLSVVSYFQLRNDDGVVGNLDGAFFILRVELNALVGGEVVKDGAVVCLTVVSDQRGTLRRVKYGEELLVVGLAFIVNERNE